jgi:hypothetical protein
MTDAQTFEVGATVQDAKEMRGKGSWKNINFFTGIIFYNIESLCGIGVKVFIRIQIDANN